MRQSGENVYRSRADGETAGSPSLPSSLPTSRTELGSRISAVADLFPSRKSAAESAGVSTDQLARYMRGENEPAVTAVVGLASGADVSIEWITTGRGSMRGGAVQRYGSDPTGALVLEDHRAEYAYIPLLDVAARAGPVGRVNEGEPVVDVLAFREDFIRQELRSSPEDLRLIFVEGDSMEPDLRAGDIVLIDQTDTRARREGIYVIRMDGALLVKQLQRLPGGNVRLLSKNPAYESFTVPMEQLEHPNGFAIIGRVVWACRRF